MKHILITRFSAMGDVAMTVPVINLLAQQHSDVKITILTRQRFVPFYQWMPKNVKVKGINLDDYKGLPGLHRLYRHLRPLNIDAVADLHDVLRTKVLRALFRMHGTRVAVIDKGRAEKKALIGKGIDVDPLKPMVQRYADTFEELGLHVDITSKSCITIPASELSKITSLVGEKKKGECWVGIAPFAAHEQKIYPLEKMQRVAQTLAEQGCRVFLFGAGKKESDILSSWEEKGIESVCGKLGGLTNEIILMSQLNCMLAMDSANMHIAAMIGTPVVSIWGATHPKAGFTPWAQPEENIIHIEGMPCRPCSIYGNKACIWGDMRCMTRLSIDTVARRVLQTVKVKELKNLKT